MPKAKFKHFFGCKFGTVAFYTSVFFLQHLVYLLNFIAKHSKALDAAIKFTSTGCSFVAVIQSVYIAIGFHITTTMDAAKLNASVECIQDVASNGCSINF